MTVNDMLWDYVYQSTLPESKRVVEGIPRAMMDQDCTSIRRVKKECNLFVMAQKDAQDIRSTAASCTNVYF